MYSNFLLLLSLLCQRFDGASTLCLIFALMLNLWAKEKSRGAIQIVASRPASCRWQISVPFCELWVTSYFFSLHFPACSPGASIWCGQELGQHQTMLGYSGLLLPLSYSVVLPFGQFPDVPACATHPQGRNTDTKWELKQELWLYFF